MSFRGKAWIGSAVAFVWLALGAVVYLLGVRRAQMLTDMPGLARAVPMLALIALGVMSIRAMLVVAVVTTLEKLVGDPGVGPCGHGGRIGVRRARLPVRHDLTALRTA